MSPLSRRSVLSALGAVLPFGVGVRPGPALPTPGAAPALQYRPFEEAVREAFAGAGPAPLTRGAGPAAGACRRVAVGDSDLVRAGVQGCHNDRAFAGFPAGRLRIVRTGTGPGPEVRGVRLYVTTVEIALTDGSSPDLPSRPLDFAELPPAPVLV